MAARPSFKQFPGAFRRLSRIAKDTTAATAIEFALILFPFLGLLGSTIDVAMLYFRATQLQIVTESSARKLLIKDISASSTDSSMSQQTYEQFRDEYVCTWQKKSGVVDKGTLSKMFDCSLLKLEIISRDGWEIGDSAINDTYQPPTQTDGFAIPTENSVVVFRIFYPVNTFFGFLGKSSTDLARDNKATNLLMGITAFRVEPGK